PQFPEQIEGGTDVEDIAAFLGAAIGEFPLVSLLWDQEAIQDSIREGKQYILARMDAWLNPSIYRVSSHDCSAQIFVPDVKVVDNCSGVHSIKAMVEVQGGTRSVELKQNGIEIKIMPNGDT